MDDFIITIWVIAYFALFGVFIYLFAVNKTDVRMSSICFAGIIGHTISFLFAVIIATDYVWPFTWLDEKFNTHDYISFDFEFVILVIEVVLLIIEIIICIILKQKGLFLPKYLPFSLAMLAIDLFSSNLFFKLASHL